MSTRHFLVTADRNVIIREIDPAQHPLHMSRPGSTLDRAEAWSFAQQLAMPSKSSQNPAAKVARQIEFIGLDGMTTVVATAQAAQQRWEARKATQNKPEAPAPTAANSPEPEVVADSGIPAGYYAIEVDGATKFYRVDRPEGKWAGYTFLKAQAGDELHLIRNRQERDNLLAIIGRDPQAASLLYGKRIGKCGVCNRTLTDATSRENGIGPVCAEKMGW